MKRQRSAISNQLSAVRGWLSAFSFQLSVLSRRLRRGMGGMIVVILVLGFMMAISTSYVLMVQTESSGGKVGETYLRARASALAGVEFVRAQLLATGTTFQDDPSRRLYWVRASAPANVVTRMTSPSGVATTTDPNDFVGLVGTQWYFPRITSIYLGDEVGSSTAFRVTSYPDNNNVATAYYVKSIGTFFDINQGNSTVLSSWSCQIVARLHISSQPQNVKLEAWRPMQLEPCNATADSFFASQTIIYP